MRTIDWETQIQEAVLVFCQTTKRGRLIKAKPTKLRKLFVKS